MPALSISSVRSPVVAHYLRMLGRPDIGATSLSGDGLDRHRGEAWAIVQDEHLTFENEALVSQLRVGGTPWREIRIADRLAAQVFRVAER